VTEPKKPTPYMKMREVYELLEPMMTRQTALRLVKTGVIPGGEEYYRTERGGARWVVSRVVFEPWFRKCSPTEIEKLAVDDEKTQRKVG
jgi:hypothetical protein